jgi:RHS repeat-associated protein
MGRRSKSQIGLAARWQLCAIRETSAGLLGALALLFGLGLAGGAAGARPVAEGGAPGASPDVVIRQVYGGGGSASAAWRADFVELFNRGEKAVDLTGWSLQYARRARSDWQLTALAGVVKPGRSYLVAESVGDGGRGADLPPPDANGSIDLGASQGAVALVEDDTALNCGAGAERCSAAPPVRDFLGYGEATGAYEGRAPASGTLPDSAFLRLQGGCVDSGDNAADFVAALPFPRSSATRAHRCRFEPWRAKTAVQARHGRRPSRPTTPRSSGAAPPPPGDATTTNDTHVCGHISVDTTWTPVGSPYILDCTLFIDAGATLTLRPGTRVGVAGDSSTSISVNGALHSEGSLERPVVITAASDTDLCDCGWGPSTAAETTARGSWNNIQINGPGSQFAYTHIRYGSGGCCSPAFYYGAVQVTGAAAGTVPFDHVVFESNKNSGLRVIDGATAQVTWSWALNNGAGITVGDLGRVLVSHSHLVWNSGSGLWSVLNSTSGYLSSQVDNSEIAANGGPGIRFWNASGLPASLWPHGAKNNIFANNGRGSAHQMDSLNTAPDTIDWNDNWWGPNSYWFSNPPTCNPAGYLASNEGWEVASGVLGYFPYTIANATGVYGSADGLSHCIGQHPAIATFSPTRISIAPDDPVPADHTIGCAGLDATNPTGCAGSVNTLAGSFNTSTIDLSLPAYGIPFRFKRSYSSNDSDPSRLGDQDGWRDNYSAFLEIDQTSGDVTLHSENGQKARYTRLQDSSFAPANPGILSTLAPAGGGYDLTRRDQTVLHFDALGQLQSEKDRNGQGLSFAYTSGRLTTITDAPGRQITLGYNPSGYLSDITMPPSDGRQVHYDYANGKLSSVTDVRGKVWSYTYDSATGKLARLEDPELPTHHFPYTNSYDPTSGRLIQTLDAVGNQIGYAWSAATSTATITDQAGKDWKHHYDKNRLVSRTDPDGKSITYDYDEKANAAGITDRNGKTTQMIYDSRGNLLRRTTPTPGSYVECWSYDGKDNPLTYRDRRGNTTSYSYDANGNLKTVTRPDPDGGGPLTAPVTSYDYDPAGTGELFSVTDARSDPGSHTTDYRYDANGNLASVTTPLGNQTTYDYFPAGWLKSVVDPRGNLSGANPDDFRRSFTYNEAGQRLTSQDALGNLTTYTYYEVGNLHSRTNARLKTWTYTYDAANRRTSTIAPDGSTVLSTTEYDPRGPVKARTKTLDATHVARTSYTFDNVGRLASKVSPRGNVSGCTCAAQYTSTYGYDANGNRTLTVDPFGAKTVTTYDELNRRTTTVAYEPGYRNVVLGDTPAGYWRLDDTNATAADSSGNAQSLGYVNPQAPTLVAGAIVDDPDSAIKLQNNYLRGSSSQFAFTGTANYTLEIWFKPNATDTRYRRLLSHETGSNRTGWNLWVQNAQLGAERWSGGASIGVKVSAAGAAPAGVWTHAAVTYNGAQICLYINGSTALGGCSASTGSIAANSSTFQIGNASAQTLSNFLGSLDEAAVYNRALSAAAIQAHYRAGVVSTTRTTSYGYDGNDNLTSRTDPMGRQTTYLYDALDQLASETQVGSGGDPSPTTTYSYDEVGNQTSVTTPLGNKTTYSYDRDNRKATMVEARGNVAGCGCAGQYTWSYGYDASGHLSSLADPVTPGHPLTYGYDRVGRQASTADQLGNTTGYGYDDLGRLQAVTAPDSSQTTYAYNDNTNDLTSRTDANLHTTQYGYDLAHRLTSRADPLGGSWTYEYDAAGNRTKEVDPKANAAGNEALGRTSYSYDRLDQLTSTDYSDTQANPDVSYSYNGFGDRIAMSDGGASPVSYVYNTDGELTSESRGSDSFSYSYDSLGNLKQEVYPGGTTVDYGHDADGRLSSVTSGGAATSYSYDAADHPLTTTLPASNGYVQTRTYDAAGRLTELKNASGAAVLSDYQLALDYAGNPTQVTKPGGALESYGYDQFNRLTSVCYQASCPGANDPFVRWTYDSVGNRLTEARPEGTTTYSYNAGDELTQAVGPQGTRTYSHDPNGRQTGAGSSSFSWNVADQLSSATVAGQTSSYSYDGDGKRLTASAGGSTTKYLWDSNSPTGELPQLALERDGAGNLLRRYLYGQDPGPLSLATPTGTFYDHYDSFGSVTKLTSAGGAPEWTYAYEPFGPLRSSSKDDPAAPANPMQFAGQYLDPNTALYNMRARQYDPAVARFLSTDPLSPDHDDPYSSAYAYASDQPTVFMDPSGMCLDSVPLVGDICNGLASGYHAASDSLNNSWNFAKGNAVSGWHCANFDLGACDDAPFAIAIAGAFWLPPGGGEGLLALRAVRGAKALEEAGVLADAFRAGERLESGEGIAIAHVAQGQPGFAAEEGTALAGYSSFRAAKTDLGSPGAGNVFDHVIERSQIGRSGFAPEEIHNPFNLNPISARANQIKANYYSSKQPFTGGLTVRDWLNGQSFRDQYEFGMDVLAQIRAGTIK